MNSVRGLQVSTSRTLAQGARTALVLTLVAGAALLAACGDKKAGATQVAAKVNKEEISVHQINFVLQRQPGLKPEQAKAASKRVLEGLIDQELALQQAQEQKLDRDPRVVMAIDAARREIIARAYADKLGETASKPSDDDIRAFYASKPALFAQRRIYSLAEFTIEADATQQAAVKNKLDAAKTPDDVVNVLRSSELKYNSRRATQAPESMPLALVDRLASLETGQRLTQASPSNLSLLFVQGTRPAPVSEPQAKAAISQFLLNEQKRKLVEGAVKDLRKNAKIDYMGQFAGNAPAEPVAAPAQPAPAASELDANALQKGLSGLK
ncbi:MAG: EpsD family peptidyl-prolyl cis-trans isomerase [Burkholderiales bacterium]